MDTLGLKAVALHSSVHKVLVHQEMYMIRAQCVHIPCLPAPGPGAAEVESTSSSQHQVFNTRLDN
jgi:hypothetical protein